MTELFKCKFCAHSHEMEKLAGSLNNAREIGTALANIETYQEKYANLYLRTDISDERKKYKEEKWTQKIKDFWLTIKNYGNVLVCSFCWAKAKSAATTDREVTETTFTCDNCHNQRTGVKWGLHVENKQHAGIDPERWSIVCDDCYKNQVVPADYYCPRTSEGRSDWDTSKPKYDCWCPVPEKYQYLTINGETVLEVIKTADKH